MPDYADLSPLAPWRNLSTTAADWAHLDPRLGGTTLASLHFIRAFEKKVLELAGLGLVHGPAHSAIGQDGGAVGVVAGSILPRSAV